MSQCPRCNDVVLAREAGAWQEDVCGRCDGRFLEQQHVERLAEHYARVGPDMLRELAGHGPRRLQCPGCRGRMTLTMLRGVQIDLCPGCGGAWLDKGELHTLTHGNVVEIGAVEVISGVAVDEPATSRTATREITMPRFAVYCINCDGELDLTQTNWLVNDRPWCASCAAPHAGVSALFTTAAGGVLSTVASFMMNTTWRALRSAIEGGGSNQVNATDTMRITPEDAEVYFGRFFRPVGYRR